MNIKKIIWLPQIEAKLWQKHGVLVEEVEELLFGKRKIRFVENGAVPGEDLYAAYGQTEAGRYLVAYFVLKEEKQALIIGARDMDRKEKKRYAD